MPVIGWKRFIVGGVGGLAPVFALLVALDFEQNLADASTAKALGYAVRVLALFAVGGFIAWLHESEGQMFKLFEIGVGAPALLAGLITSQSVVQQPLPPPPASASAISWVPLGAAHAQAAPPTKGNAKVFSAPRQTGGAGFWEGLSGTRPTNVYYVVAGSHPSYEQARAQADRINTRTPSYNAKVYAPYGGNPYYAVVIGEQLPAAQAQQVRRNAVAAGVAREAYLWRPS